MFILNFMKKLNFIQLFILSIFLIMITTLIRNYLRDIDINKHPIIHIILGIVGIFLGITTIVLYIVAPMIIH